MLFKSKLVLVLLLLMPVGSVFAGEQLSFNDIKQLAEQGNAKAQAQYAAINFLGDDFQLKPSARFKAKQALKAISHLLEGVTSDYEVATKWMLKAANQNYIDAEVFMVFVNPIIFKPNAAPSELRSWIFS